MNPHWTGLADFLAMGGHGPWVWGSYGLALVAMLAEPWLAARRHRQALAAAAAARLDGDDDLAHDRTAP